MDDAITAYARLGAAVMEFWPEAADIDIGDLQDMAIKAGVLKAVPGGFDPEEHEDTCGYGAEPGDEWFMRIPVPKAIKDAQG